MKKIKGFTLVELVLVIGVLLMLSVLGIAGYGGIRRNAQVTRREANASALAASINTYNATASSANRITNTQNGNDTYITTALATGGLTPTFSKDVTGGIGQVLDWIDDTSGNGFWEWNGNTTGIS